MNRHALRVFLLLSMSAGGCSIGSFAQVINDTIPLGGNAWSDPAGGGIDTWFRVTSTGKLHVWINAQATDAGPFGISVSLGHGAGVDLPVGSTGWKSYDAGVFEVTDTGYQCIHIKEVSRTKAALPTIQSIIVQGQPINSQTAFVPNNEGNFFFWGRRGP